MNKNSLDAYRSIGAHLDGHYFDIYQALLAKGPQNAWDISQTTAYYCDVWLAPDQVFRRLSEMVKAGWIEKLDWDTVTSTGCYASTYWVKV